MLKDKIKIILRENDNDSNERRISLQSMSVEELASFMVVVGALKVLSQSLADQKDLTFSIFEGSAACAVEGNESCIDSIHSGIDLALKGESDNEKVTSSLRDIKKEVSKDRYSYRILYDKRNNETISLDDRIREVKSIRTKKKKKKLANIFLLLVQGRLNEIGGKKPNYHLDYVEHRDTDEKITVSCTVEEAKSINRYLYNNVYALTIRCVNNDPDKKDTYIHQVIVEESTLAIEIKDFLQQYYELDLVDRLVSVHKFIDRTLSKDKERGLKLLCLLLKAFNYKDFHSSELKTLLIISKPFKNKPEFIDRENLLATYNKKRKARQAK